MIHFTSKIFYCQIIEPLYFALTGAKKRPGIFPGRLVFLFKLLIRGLGGKTLLYFTQVLALPR